MRYFSAGIHAQPRSLTNIVVLPAATQIRRGTHRLPGPGKGARAVTGTIRGRPPGDVVPGGAAPGSFAGAATSSVDETGAETGGAMLPGETMLAVFAAGSVRPAFPVSPIANPADIETSAAAATPTMADLKLMTACTCASSRLTPGGTLMRIVLNVFSRIQMTVLQGEWQCRPLAGISNCDQWVALTQHRRSAQPPLLAYNSGPLDHRRHFLAGEPARQRRETAVGGDPQLFHRRML
jgi:hypothetical protein